MARPLLAVLLLAAICGALGQQDVQAAVPLLPTRPGPPKPAPRPGGAADLTCAGRCGKTYIANGVGGHCHCDYWCNNRDDCCGGAASKNALCPTMVPTLNKVALTNCDAPLSEGTSGVPRTYYRPGMCWCDATCVTAGDCCITCAMCKRRRRRAEAQVEVSAAADPAAAEVSAALAPLWERVQAQAAKLAAHAGPHHDCGAPHSAEELVAKARSSAARGGAASPMADVSAVASSLMSAEATMQACQAADPGTPATPIKVPIHWTAGQVCDNAGACVGGKYSAALVRKQIELTNAIFAHVGIQFVWDGVIHKATASDAYQIDVGYSRGDWICNQQRHGDGVAVNVMTSPIHPGGAALGVTLYPSYFSTGQLPMCANWVFIFEKTLPDQGGRSMIDGLLCDGGATLTHEIGHQMMLAHTWNQIGGGSVGQQCELSASMDLSHIVDGYSDGVRDTVAQSLNDTNPVTNILRFVGCNPETGAYTNNTLLAQQSCHSGTGFPAGDGYYNNYNNLMSYGDRYCLRTLTPGQGARARCAIRCLRGLGGCLS